MLGKHGGDVRAQGGAVDGASGWRHDVADKLPVTGEVVELNESVVDSPETVNSDPYDAGWLFKVRAESVPDLLDADAYAALIQEG